MGDNKGRIFGYGRFFWVHNPLGAALGKANDPFMNWMTLRRLSHHTSGEVRAAVAQNVAERFSRKFSAVRLAGFNRAVIIEAVARAPSFPSNGFMYEVVVRTLRITTPEAKEIIDNSKGAQPLLLHIINSTTMGFPYRHGEWIDPQEKAREISENTPKSIKVVDSKEKGHNEYNQAESNSWGGDLAHGPSPSFWEYVIDSPEKSHYEYSIKDIEKACVTIGALQPFQQLDVFFALKKINPVLAEGVAAFAQAIFS